MKLKGGKPFTIYYLKNSYFSNKGHSSLVKVTEDMLKEYCAKLTLIWKGNLKTHEI